MPRIKAAKTTFANGELDPALLGRFDLKAYRNGADKLRNVLCKPQGGVIRRPGLEYIATALKVLTAVDLTAGGVTVSAPNGGTAGNAIDANLATEVITTGGASTTDPFVIVHVDLGSAVQVEFVDVFGLRLVSGSTTSDEEVQWQYSADDAAWTIFENAIDSVGATDLIKRATGDQTKRYWRLVRIGGTDLTTDNFAIDEIKFYTESATVSDVRFIPFVFSTTQDYMIVATDLNLAIYRNDVLQINVPIPMVSAELVNLNWTQNLDTLVLFHEDHNPRKIVRSGAHDEWNAALNTFTNIPTFDFGAGAEAVISTTRGWPLSGTFFGGRLYLAGLKSRPQTVLGTTPGSIVDLDDSTTADDKAINVTADTDDVSAFYNVFAGRHLQFFASSAEFYVPISEDTGLTPTNFVLRRTTQRGSKKGTRVFEVDGATMFLQGGGKAVREFLFIDTESAYQAQSLSLLSSHLVVTSVDMGLRKATSTSDADYIWVVNSDGTIAAFCTLRLQEVNAWTLLKTDGTFEAVGTLGEKSYFAVERTINSVTSVLIEKFNDDLHMDAGKRETGGGAYTNATGLTWLEGEALDVRLDGMSQAQLTVASGTVTFARSATTTYEVGLPFPDVTTGFAADDPDLNSGVGTFIRTLPAEEALPEGTTLGKRKRVVEVTARIKDTIGIKINKNFVPSRQYGSALLDTATTPVTGDVTVGGLLGWTLAGDVRISQDDPDPMEILALGYKLAV